MGRDKIIRFSVSLPQKLLDEFDLMIKNQDYASRSEFTRDLIRQKLVEECWENDDSELIGVFTIIYDHHEGELMRRKMMIEHNTKVCIICTNHIHIDHYNCLENMTLRGRADLIEEFSQKISGLKGVKFAKLVRAGVPEH